MYVYGLLTGECSGNATTPPECPVIMITTTVMPTATASPTPTGTK